MTPNRIGTDDRRALLVALYLRAYGTPQVKTTEDLKALFDNYKIVETALVLAAGEIITPGISTLYVSTGSVRPSLRMRPSKAMKQKIDDVANLVRRAPSTSSADILERAEIIFRSLTKNTD